MHREGCRAIFAGYITLREREGTTKNNLVWDRAGLAHCWMNSSMALHVNIHALFKALSFLDSGSGRKG